MRDLRYAIRRIARQPAFSALVVGTLALGIGASTLMFSVLRGVLLKPLPYADPDRLVWIYGAFRLSQTAAVSPPDFLDYRAGNDVFDSLGAMAIGISGVTVSEHDGPRRLQASLVTAGLLSTLATSFVAGRDFARHEERLGSGAVIATERLARERFGSATAALGQPVVVNGQAMAIVGVVPAAFTLPYDSFIRLREPVDLFMPVPLDAPDAQVRRFHSLRLIGRLKPGTTVADAQSQMDVIARRLEAAYPENETWRLRLVPLHERVVGDVRPMLRLLTGAVGLLLAIACGNVAGLMLFRAAARRDEMALQAALGASRWRVARQAFAESAILCACAAVAGLVITAWGVVVLARLAPTLPRVGDLRVDLQVVLFTALIAGLTTVLFGSVPLFAASGRDVVLAPGAPGRATAGRAATRVRAALMVLQVAASVVMLTGAGLLTRSFAQLLAVDTGFAAEDVLVAHVSLRDDEYPADPQVEAAFRTMLERVAAMPGIQSAALATVPPLSGATDTAVHPEGRPPSFPRDRAFAQIRRVQGRYFETLQIPIVAGRALDDDVDRPASPVATVITQNLAERMYGTADAVGRRLVIDLGAPTTAEIVGIAADIRAFGPEGAPPPTVYLSARQQPSTVMHIVVRTARDAPTVAAALRDIVRSVDPDVAPAPIRSMQGLLDESVAQPRFRMLLLAAFASAAIALTLVGLYGALAYAVAERRRELGIRLALGASPRRILGLVLRQGALVVGAGLTIGLIAAVFLSRYVAALLFEVRPLDPAVFLAVPSLVCAAALVPVMVPAVRAARIDPVTALRAE